MNRGDVYAYKGLGRAGYVAIISNNGFNAITGHPLVVKVSDRPDLTETPYVVALSPDDPIVDCEQIVCRWTFDSFEDTPFGSTRVLQTVVLFPPFSLLANSHTDFTTRTPS